MCARAVCVVSLHSLLAVVHGLILPAQHVTRSTLDLRVYVCDYRTTLCVLSDNTSAPFLRSRNAGNRPHAHMHVPRVLHSSALIRCKHTKQRYTHKHTYAPRSSGRKRPGSRGCHQRRRQPVVACLCFLSVCVCCVRAKAPLPHTRDTQHTKHMCIHTHTPRHTDTPGPEATGWCHRRW